MFRGRPWYLQWTYEPEQNYKDGEDGWYFVGQAACSTISSWFFDYFVYMFYNPEQGLIELRYENT